MMSKTALFVALVLKMTALSDQIRKVPTALYNRCMNYSRWHPCLEYENYGCKAKKVADGTFNDDKYRCTIDCPPPPDSVCLSVFKQPCFLDKQELYTGMNLSWTIDTKDNSYHYVDGFRIELRSTEHYLIKYIDVDVERQPIDKYNKIWFYYDCFYPIMKNRAWFVTIRTIPYNVKLLDNERRLEFVLDKNGDGVQEICWPDSLSVPLDFTTRSANFQHPASLPCTSSLLSTEVDKESATVQILSVTTGVLVGLTCLVIAALVSFMIRQGSPDSLDPSRYQKNKSYVMLIYTKDSVTHVQQSENLASALSDICHVTDIWNVEASDVRSTSDVLSETLQRADVVVIVYSHYIREKLQQLMNKTPVHKSVDLALYFIVNNSRKANFRVLTVYFPETTACNVIEGTDWPQPIALPANLDVLRHQIRSAESWSVSSDKDNDTSNLYMPTSGTDSVSMEGVVGSQRGLMNEAEELSLRCSDVMPVNPASARAGGWTAATPSLHVGPVGEADPLCGVIGDHQPRVQLTDSSIRRDQDGTNVSLPSGAPESNDSSRPPPFKSPFWWVSIDTDIQSECIASINDEHVCIHHGNNPFQLLSSINTSAAGVGRMAPEPSQSRLSI